MRWHAVALVGSVLSPELCFDAVFDADTCCTQRGAECWDDYHPRHLCCAAARLPRVRRTGCSFSLRWH